MEILFFLIGEHADGNAHQVNNFCPSKNQDWKLFNIILISVQVNGAVVNVRGKGDKLAVWVTDSANTEAVVSYIYYI